MTHADGYRHIRLGIDTYHSIVVSRSFGLCINGVKDIGTPTCPSVSSLETDAEATSPHLGTVVSTVNGNTKERWGRSSKKREKTEGRESGNRPTFRNKQKIDDIEGG